MEANGGVFQSLRGKFHEREKFRAAMFLFLSISFLCFYKMDLRDKKIIGTPHLIFVGRMRNKNCCNNINHRMSARTFMPSECAVGRKDRLSVANFGTNPPGALRRA
jgi:hypothetical protein